jgi:hypothetical protein
MFRNTDSVAVLPAPDVMVPADLVPLSVLALDLSVPVEAWAVSLLAVVSRSRSMTSAGCRSTAVMLGNSSPSSAKLRSGDARRRLSGSGRRLSRTSDGVRRFGVVSRRTGFPSVCPLRRLWRWLRRMPARADGRC